MTFVRYRPEVETPLPEEDALLIELETMMVNLAKHVRDKHGHAFHGTHAKLTGLLAGSFDVLADLPPELAQGMFAVPRRYDAIVRYAPGPPEPLTDRASGQRGMSIKVLGVEGERVADSGETRTQDWVLGLDPAFVAADARAFQRTFRRTGAKSPYLPESAILAMSRVARGIEAALEAVGTESPNLKFFGRPQAHPLAESFYLQAPVRYGDYVAKLAAFPSQELRAAIGQAPPLSDSDDAFREAAALFLSQREAVYDVKVQLCTDLATMPVEDASITWPESESPYRSVARLTLPPQQPWTDARAAYDDRLAFNPAHALLSHRPLGSIMRARSRAYRAVQLYRQAANGLTPAEPTTSADMPA